MGVEWLGFTTFAGYYMQVEDLQPCSYLSSASKEMDERSMRKVILVKIEIVGLVGGWRDYL